MFFIDIAKQKFKGKVALSAPCQQCKHNEIETRAEIKFLTLSILPLLPLSTHYEMLCSQCKYITNKTVTDKNLIPWFNVLNKFIGLILFITLTVFIWQKNLAEKDNEFKILAKPKPFDIYLIDHSKLNQEADYRKEFVVAKVVSVSENNVSILISNYAYQHKNQVIKAIQLDTLLFDNFYGVKPKKILRNTLKSLREQDTIYRALRPENLSLFGGLVMMPQKPAVLYKGFKPHPINQQAVTSYQNGFFKEAFELFSQAAAQGDTWAQINLGQMYRDGEGHEVNTRQALNLFKQAKISGNKKAEYEYQQLCQQVKDCSPIL